MEVTAVVLHEGALAHYDVSIENGGRCDARLLSYNGNSSQSPPEQISLKKEGRHWLGTSTDQQLSDDLGYAIESKAKPILEQRKREGGHPAG